MIKLTGEAIIQNTNTKPLNISEKLLPIADLPESEKLQFRKRKKKY